MCLEKKKIQIIITLDNVIKWVAIWAKMLCR